MKNCLRWSGLAWLAIAVMVSPVQGAARTLKMSTTTSTQSSGLLEVLLPVFEKDSGIIVKVIAKGTGAALRDGMDGNVDLIMVHALERELQFVSQGYGTKRYSVMHNDFILVGPPSDPAAIKGMRQASEMLAKIAASRALFVSRGDDSGTHTKEQELWRLAAVPLITKTELLTRKGKELPVTFSQPAAAAGWYLSIGQGMGKTLNFADEKKAYTLADRGTFLKYKLGSEPPIALEIVGEGDAALANPYGVIPVNPAQHPHVKYEEARTFAEWLVSAKGQKVIGDYQLLGQPLFFPDALP